MTFHVSHQKHFSHIWLQRPAEAETSCGRNLKVAVGTSLTFHSEAEFVFQLYYIKSLPVCHFKQVLNDASCKFSHVSIKQSSSLLTVASTPEL